MGEDMWNQRAFDLIAGSAVFVGITLLLADWQPEFVYAILTGAIGLLLLNHVEDVKRLTSNYRSYLGKQ